MQGELLIELIKALKAEDIHVALDTSGYGDLSYAKEILSLVDMVLLDIKHVDTLSHKRLVGLSMNGLHEFIKHLSKSSVNVWIRHLMVPTLTDYNEIMDKLYNLVESFNYLVEKFEILPYHKLGVEKYSQLGMKYPLGDIPEMNSVIAKSYEDILNEKLRLGRTENSSIKKLAM